MNPEELLDDLPSTELGRTWGTLYSALIDDYFIDTSDCMDGIDIGDVTFTDTAITVVFCSQLNSWWYNTMFSKRDTTGQTGCGPSPSPFPPLPIQRPSVQG